MIEICKSKIIGVEGQDEINFFYALLNNLGINDIQLLNFEGKTKFQIKIKSIVNIPGFKKVNFFGLIRDADTNNATSAFDSVLESLIKANLPVPDTINTFIRAQPSIGVFIMPDNLNSGMLEDLCLSSIEKHKINSCINEFQKCFDEPPKNSAKARVQCYLASKNPLVNSLGLGALKGHWDFESPVYDRIKNFILAMA